MDLLQRFAAGDLEAFESLFRQYQGEVYRWIMRIVRNSATAEDLTVETFWRMYRARAQFDPSRGTLGPWLRRIATNAALDHLRRSRREVPLPDDLPATRSSRPPSNSSFAAKFLPPSTSSRLRFAPSSCSPWWRKNPTKISLRPWTFPKTP